MVLLCLLLSSHLQHLREEITALQKRLAQCEHDRSTLLAAMSNADALHREQLQQLGSSLREALTREQQQAQHAQQQWSTEKADLTAALEAAEEQVSAYDASFKEGLAFAKELRGTAQGLQKSMSEADQTLKDRDAEAAKMLSSVTDLSHELDNRSRAVERHYAESRRDYIKASAAVFAALQDMNEALADERQSEADE
jgi:chromosome segregation ATPase